MGDHDQQFHEVLHKLYIDWSEMLKQVEGSAKYNDLIQKLKPLIEKLLQFEPRVDEIIN